MAVKSWIYKIVHQSIIKEIKKVNKKNKAPYSEILLALNLEEVRETRGSDGFYELDIDYKEIVKKSKMNHKV